MAINYFKYSNFYTRIYDVLGGNKMDMTALLFGGIAIVSLCIALIFYALLLQAIKDKSIMERKYIGIVENLSENHRRR